MFKKLFLGVFSFILFAMCHQASAQDDYVSEVTYQLPNGPFEIFGQIIDPSVIDTGKDELGWNELRLMMPVVIPNLKEHEMDANQLCDYMVILSDGYSGLMERVQVPIAKKLGGMGYDLKMAPEQYISNALGDVSLSGVDKLISLMPEDEAKINFAREVTLKNLTSIMLRDASINACSEYAKERGYKGVYVGFEPYNPANDSGWKDVPWYKEERSEAVE